MNIERPVFYQRLLQAFSNHQVVAILGPRQCGKTTFAKQYIQQIKNFDISNYFDLENPIDANKLQDPMLHLEDRAGLIVIDEIQKIPDLFPVIRVLVDQHQPSQRYLILGSASRDLIRQSSETLAGRISYLELTPFILSEVPDTDTLWIRGGFPKSYLAATDIDSWDWRLNYISTYLERDIPNLGINIPAAALRRFWIMLSHYHGQQFNASEIARSLGVSDTTAKRYLDILTGTFMIRSLQPWFENIKKRQIKTTKIYFRDTGILHSLIGITNKQELLHHPKLGASWEGFALEQIIMHHQALPEECYYWGIHAQAELDLMIIKYGKRLGFEIKYSKQPKIAQSILTSIELLKLNEFTIIIPGIDEYQLAKNITVVGLERYIANKTQTVR